MHILKGNVIPIRIMGLKRELQNLDTELAATAIGIVLGQLATGSGLAADLAAALHREQPILSILPTVIQRTKERLEPETDPGQLQQLTTGMTLAFVILTEYAELDEFRTQFPDMPPDPS